MWRPDAGALAGTQAAWSTAQPAAAGGTMGADGQAFAPVFRRMQEEIRDIIARGWPADAGTPALSLEGHWRRAALTPTEAADGVEQGASEQQQRSFLAQMRPWAEEAARSLGVAPEIVAAHAALESGWGQRPLRGADGRDSHNLFGIKAQPSWSGARIDAATTEYEGGVAQGRTETFRSYPDHAAAFRDYARFLQDNPRYRAALQTGTDAAAFAQALARAGYATDPAYAAKLTRIAGQLQSLD